MKNKIIILIIVLSIIFCIFNNYNYSASFSVITNSNVYLVGSDIKLNITGNDVIGKVVITSSNSSAVLVNNSEEWIDGTINITLKAKSAGESYITIKSIDTADAKSGDVVNISQKIKIIVTESGDLNNDKKIDVTDAYNLLTIISNNKVIDENQKKIADVNNDGKVDVTDAYLLLKMISEV